MMWGFPSTKLDLLSETPENPALLGRGCRGDWAGDPFSGEMLIYSYNPLYSLVYGCIQEIVSISSTPAAERENRLNELVRHGIIVRTSIVFKNGFGVIPDPLSNCSYWHSFINLQRYEGSASTIHI